MLQVGFDKEEIKESKLKCPKCRSKNLLLLELWKGHCVEFQQEAGKIDWEWGNLNEGNPYKVQAKCTGCNHYWTVRGAVQISDCYKD